MANSLDPDQTSPTGTDWSGPAMFAYVILSEILVYKILGHLPFSENLKKLDSLGTFSAIFLQETLLLFPVFFPAHQASSE